VFAGFEPPANPGESVNAGRTIPINTHDPSAAEAEGSRLETH
jgi:hypothetical protein